MLGIQSLLQNQAGAAQPLQLQMAARPGTSPLALLSPATTSPAQSPRSCLALPAPVTCGEPVPVEAEAREELPPTGT